MGTCAPAEVIASAGASLPHIEPIVHAGFENPGYERSFTAFQNETGPNRDSSDLPICPGSGAL